MRGVEGKIEEKGACEERKGEWRGWEMKREINDRGGEGKRLTVSRAGRRLEASYADITEGSICTSHKDQ